MEKNIRFIVMISGYVESSQVSPLIWQCQFFGKPGYTSYREAITDLALDLYAKYYDAYLSIYEDRYSKRVKECCRKTLIANKESKFCSECGAQLVDKKFDAEHFMQFIKDLHGLDTDSWGDAEWSNGRSFSWWPFWVGQFIGAPKEDVIFLSQYAEVILLQALLDAKPELRDEDSDYAADHFSDDWEQFKNEIHPPYSA